MLTYITTTGGVTVSIRPLYLDAQSDVLERRFVFGCYVQIRNDTQSEIQLQGRYWYIQDRGGTVEEEEENTLHGEMPILEPGDTYRRGRYCSLRSFEGALEGNYIIETEAGDRFRADAPRVTLRALAN